MLFVLLNSFITIIVVAGSQVIQSRVAQLWRQLSSSRAS